MIYSKKKHRECCNDIKAICNNIITDQKEDGEKKEFLLELVGLEFVPQKLTCILSPSFLLPCNI